MTVHEIQIRLGTTTDELSVTVTGLLTTGSFLNCEGQRYCTSTFPLK